MKLEELAPTRVTLPNGLRLVVASMPSVHEVVVAAHLRVGARHERKSNNGISHLLEHMLFRGIPSHRTARDQALAFESLGTSVNAATSSDTGELTMASPPESFAEALPLFGEVLSRPLLSELDIEKGIVREEILEDLDEHGKQVDPDVLLQERVFEDHSLGLPITGTVRQVDGFDVAALRQHHETFYRAENMVVTIAGPLDADDAIELADRSIRDLGRGGFATTEPPPMAKGASFRFVKNSSSQTELRVGFRSVGLDDEDEPAMDLVRRLLDDGMATRLYRRICDERGLCYDVGASHESYEDAGLLTLDAETQHERALQVLEEMLTVVASLRDDGPSDEELERAKARHRWQHRALLDDPEHVAELLGESAIQGRSTTPHTRCEQIDRVSRVDLAATASRVLTADNLCVVAVGLQPKRTREAMARRVDDFQ